MLDCPTVTVEVNGPTVESDNRASCRVRVDPGEPLWYGREEPKTVANRLLSNSMCEESVNETE